MPLNASIEALARKNHSAILQAMASISQARVAERMGISESKLTRMKEGGDESDLMQVALMLAACNMLGVPRSYTAVDPERLRAITTLARDSLAIDALPSDWGSL